MKVYTTGVFDLLHRGHLNILTQAAALGELVVGVMSDAGVEATKGRRPILTTEERLAQIRSLPFVADAFAYADTDQCANYESIKPDVIVQGDDWLHSADRATALEYIRTHKLRLVLLPRTDGISTTEIRKRAERSVRRDEAVLMQNLRSMPIGELRIYEEFDEAKVRRLVERIEHSATFLNPISIVREGIVIDGVNRLEALRRLGARQAPCVVYDYTDVDLLANVHFVQDGKRTRLSEFAREDGERIEFPRRSPQDILHAVERGQMIPNGETFHRVPYSVIRLPVALELLRHETFDLAAHVRARIEAGEVRFFQSSVYVCDEW
jgi:cytidyltransferase-like protein